MGVHELAAAQPLLIGLLLLWSSYGKFANADQAERTALPRLVGESHARLAYQTVGGIEAGSEGRLVQSEPPGGAPMLRGI